MAEQPPKPTVHLLKPAFTAESLAELWHKLTGREPTPEGMEAFRPAAEEMAKKQPPDDVLH
jgi:hypothetical protein